MAKYICSICGYVHDDGKDGLFSELPDEWVCPLCKADKSVFTKESSAEQVPEVSLEVVHEDKELTSLEVSILCSNLARGCEKQYLPQEAALFTQLADYFKSVAPKAEDASTEQLLSLVKHDLEVGFPQANAVTKAAADRGAMRALTWSIKVTLILSSLLERYQKLGDAMLENTGVYVCTICGFVYIGDNLPDLCPICKVPNDRFEEMMGGR